MSNLPTEILNSIFTHLHLEQKVECMLVCQKWAQVIRAISLFHTLVLQPDDNFSYYSPLMKRLEKYPQQSSQVRRLIIFGGFHQGSDPNKLFRMFPQLHVLYLHQLHVLQPDPAAVKTKHLWQHSLKQLVEQRTDVFSTALLKTGVFHRLTNLSLTNGSGSEANNVFTLLENTPALRKLELENYYISWQQFELLHKNVPQLSELQLNSVRVPRERYRHSVEPNAHLKKLIVRRCQLDLDSQVHWIRYIIQKYSYLILFSFAAIVNILDVTLDADGYHERLIKPLIDGLGTQLETFISEYWIPSRKLIEALDAKGYRLKELGLASLESTSRTNHHLLESRQAAYLRKLSLYQVDFESFKDFKVFEQLKSLSLDFTDEIEGQDRVPIALNGLLSELPNQLEELKLVSCAVRIEPFISSCPSNIRSLTFHDAELDGPVSVFISDYCRDLRSLSLTLCQPGLSTILLPYHRLTCFEIFSHNTQPIFRLTMDGQDYYYNMNRTLLRGLGKMKTYFDLQDTAVFATRTTGLGSLNSRRHTIHLTCASLSALYINTRLAI